MALLISASVLMADGGRILLRKQAGPMLVTAFGTPRVGPTDITVLVQGPNGSPVLDADVNIRAGDSDVRAIPGTNKLMYTAVVRLPRAGKVPLIIRVGAIEVSGEIQVEPEAPPLIAYWPYFALVPLGVALFTLNQWLKSKRRVRRL